MNNLESPPEPVDEDQARLRDAVVGRAQVPPPEPWFIRDIRQRTSSDEGQPGQPVKPPPVVNVAPAPSQPAAQEAVASQTPPEGATKRVAGMLMLAAVAAVAGVLMALGLRGSPAPAPAPVVVTRFVAAPASAGAGTSTAAAVCTRPETVDRLRAIVADAVPGISGSEELAGISLGATGQPVATGNPASACTGWLTLQLPGVAPLVVPVSYVATDIGQVSKVTGLAPLVARLAEARQAPRTPPTVTVHKPVRAVKVASNLHRAVAKKPAPSIARSRQPGGPSFSCRSPRSAAARLICGDRGLAAQDRDVSRRLNRVAAAATPGELRRIDAERTLFLNRREGCDSAACVRQLYRRQLGALRDRP